MDRLPATIHRSRWHLTGLLVAVGLSACVDPSEKIATGLVRYGLDEPEARCVGDRLEAKLSMAQLQQLGRAAKTLDHGGARQPLTVGDLIRVSAELKDVRIPLEVGRAAAGCGVLTAGAAR